MKRFIKEYIKENMKCMILLVVFLIGGITLGAYTSFKYDADTVKRITDFFNSSFHILKTETPDLKGVFSRAFLSALKASLFIWIPGFTVIGTPVILFIVLKCGFMPGFAASFLIRIFSYKVIPAAVVCILSQCLFFIPCVLFLSCESMKLSRLLFSMLTGRIKYRLNLKQLILRYFLILAAALIIMIVYSLCEAYLGANLIRLCV